MRVYTDGSKTNMDIVTNFDYSSAGDDQANWLLGGLIEKELINRIKSNSTVPLPKQVSKPHNNFNDS